MNLDWIVQTSSDQTFEPIIQMFKSKEEGDGCTVNCIGHQRFINLTRSLFSFAQNHWKLLQIFD